MVKSVVSWSQEIENLKSGREYLVATYYSSENSNNDTATYHIAKWYNEGDKVLLHRKPEKSISEMTAEERLLHTIFGSRSEVEISLSGFYVETSNPDLMLEERIEEGFLEDVMWLGNEFYWSELPVAPKGLITQDEWNEKLKINRKIQREREIEELKTEVNISLENPIFSEGMGKIMEKVLKGMEGDTEDEMEIHDNIFGATYSILSSDYAKVFIQCCEFYKVLNKIVSEKIDLQEMFKKIKETNDYNIFSDLFDKDVSISYKCRQIFLRVLVDMKKRNFEFYRFQNVKKNPNKSDMVKILLDAGYKDSINVRAARLLKLLEIGAPQVILSNEFRMLTEKVLFMYSFENNNLVKVDGVGFGITFGVNFDGSKFDYEALEDFAGESDEEVSEEEDESEELVIGVDYPYFAIIETPNYLMYEGDLVIYDNEACKYYTNENDEVMFWTVDKYKEAKELCDKLNDSKMSS